MPFLIVLINFDAQLNPFIHNVIKWPNILVKSCGVNNVLKKSLTESFIFCEVMETSNMSFITFVITFFH